MTHECTARDDLGYLRDLLARKLRKSGNGVEVTGSGFFFAPPLDGLPPEDQPRPEADLYARIGPREYRITIREAVRGVLIPGPAADEPEEAETLAPRA